MNLVDDPWIPCIRRDGMVRPASLRDCFTSSILPCDRMSVWRSCACCSA